MDLKELEIKGMKLTAFNKKGIYTVEDLVNYLPRKYYDFTKPKRSIRDLKDGEYDSIVGTVIDYTSKNKGSLINVKLKDENNRSFGVTFFNQPFIMKGLNKGGLYIVCGVIKILKDYNGYATITNPIVFSNEISKYSKIYPVYSKIEKTSDSFLQSKINSSIAIVNKEDYIEPILLNKYNLIPLYKAIRLIHQPKTMNDVQLAKKRILFDDLFQFNFKVKEHSIDEESYVKIKSFKKAKELMDSLPFELTEGQRLALRNLSNKMKQNKKINALVQGDVGCGKTLVAILLMSVVSGNGYQSCLVAPTEILASQHYKEVKERMEPLGFNVGYLTGRLKKSEQKKILKKIKDGIIDIVVGTHALMNSGIEFKNLGLSIIDEEHRFGVEQRDSLKREGVHVVSMSATPIPRTIAMSLYGNNIEVETIKTLPRGRQPIETHVVNNDKKENVYKKILEELKKGRQAYIICPLIKESKSDSEIMKNIANVDSEYKYAQKYFNSYGFNVGFVTGDDNIDTDQVLSDFKDKKIDVLIATTIVEVGVNVPNSTIIAILNAERFGFAQIHQLRGRVGRGSYKSYCYLLSDNPDKFKIFISTNDGFEISKADLSLRGAGSFLGTQQSGNNKYLMLILANEELNNNICKDIDLILKDKNRLKRYRLLQSKEFDDLK